MYYLIGSRGGRKGMVMSSPQRNFLLGFKEVMENKYPEIKLEIIPGIDYEEFAKRKKDGTV